MFGYASGMMTDEPVAPAEPAHRYDLRRDHPAFDLAMELLCILGIVPLHADDAAQELDCDAETVDVLALQLRERGYPVRRGASTRAPVPTYAAGIHYWLRRSGALAAIAAAEVYHARVYGGG